MQQPAQIHRNYDSWVKIASNIHIIAKFPEMLIMPTFTWQQFDIGLSKKVVTSEALWWLKGVQNYLEVKVGNDRQIQEECREENPSIQFPCQIYPKNLSNTSSYYCKLSLWVYLVLTAYSNSRCFVSIHYLWDIWLYTLLITLDRSLWNTMLNV